VDKQLRRPDSLCSPANVERDADTMLFEKRCIGLVQVEMELFTKLSDAKGLPRHVYVFELQTRWFYVIFRQNCRYSNAFDVPVGGGRKRAGAQSPDVNNQMLQEYSEEWRGDNGRV